LGFAGTLKEERGGQGVDPANQRGRRTGKRRFSFGRKPRIGVRGPKGTLGKPGGFETKD